MAVPSTASPAPPQRAHIVMCGDSAYLQHIAVCMLSLLHHNPQISFDLVVMITRMAAQEVDKLKISLSGQPNASLRLVDFDPAQLAAMPLMNGYPPEVYARFWIEDHFAEEVERVIYLDGDMVVVGSIAELLAVKLDQHLLAAVSIPGSARAAILGYDPADEYFNSGVMVINLRRWRAIGAREQLLRATPQIIDKLNDADQDVLNYCFHDQRLPLDYVWNAITPFFRTVNDLPLGADEIARVRRDARIVHFNGVSKPWHYLCQHPHAATYRRFLARTAWRDYRPPDYTAVNIVKRLVSRTLGERRSIAVRRVLRTLTLRSS